MQQPAFTIHRGSKLRGMGLPMHSHDEAQLIVWLLLHELSVRAATSVRSVSRLFPKETGLTFKAWRQRARIVQAMDSLARGTPIVRVSTEFGFSSTAAFSSAFRQVTAMTPTQFLGPAGQ